MFPKSLLPCFHFTGSRRRRLRQVAAVAITVVTVSAPAAGCATSESPAESRSAKSPSTQPATADPSSFTGLWSGHGNFLQINKDGSFEIGARVYAFCDEAPPPCDAMSSDGVITDGYQASGRLTSVNGTVATGNVTNSNSPDWLPTGSLTMTLNPATDSISAAGINYCGPDAPRDLCG